MTTREEVLERDNHTCFMCAMRNQERPVCGWNRILDTHHIDGRTGERLKDTSRIITLCRWHHQYSENSPHGDPKGWKKNILEKVDEYLEKYENKD